MNVDEFDCTNEFKYSVVYIIAKQINLSDNVFQRTFHQSGNEKEDKPISLVCRWCLSPYKSENTPLKHQQNIEQQQITSIKTSIESPIYWKTYCHNLKLCFLIYANFESDNEIDNSNTGDETTSFYKQTPARNGYYIVSD